jgi:hypothetical protein
MYKIIYVHVEKLVVLLTGLWMGIVAMILIQEQQISFERVKIFELFDRRPILLCLSYLTSIRFYSQTEQNDIDNASADKNV